MNNSITVLVGQCTMQINLDLFFADAPLLKSRKLFKYLFQEPWRNTESIKVLLGYLPARVDGAKVAWHDARTNYTNGYVNTQFRLDLRTREKQAVERRNKTLLAKVKTAKRKYESWVKINALYFDLVSRHTK